METCTVCGKVETPLHSGVCPDCEIGFERPRAPAAASRSYAAPSMFLGTGLLALVFGLGLHGSMALGGTMRFWGFLALLAGTVWYVIGGILISVGVIRWAIWPLIEAANRNQRD